MSRLDVRLLSILVQSACYFITIVEYVLYMCVRGRRDQWWWTAGGGDSGGDHGEAAHGNLS